MKLHRIATLSLLSVLVSVPALAAPQNAANYKWGRTNAPGWSLMTKQERTEYQEKMHAVSTYDECKTIQEDHRKEMDERAKSRGLVPHKPFRNGCDNMRAKGYLK